MSKKKTNNEMPLWIASAESGIDEVLEEAKEKACAFANVAADFSAESRIEGMQKLEALAQELSTMAASFREYIKRVEGWKLMTALDKQGGK